MSAIRLDLIRIKVEKLFLRKHLKLHTIQLKFFKYFKKDSIILHILFFYGYEYKKSCQKLNQDGVKLALTK